jgi:hypothetical protein
MMKFATLQGIQAFFYPLLSRGVEFRDDKQNTIPKFNAPSLSWKFLNFEVKFAIDESNEPLCIKCLYSHVGKPIYLYTAMI